MVLNVTRQQICILYMLVYTRLRELQPRYPSAGVKYFSPPRRHKFSIFAISFGRLAPLMTDIGRFCRCLHRFFWWTAVALTQNRLQDISFLPSTITVWNRLPVSLASAPSHGSFKAMDADHLTSIRVTKTSSPSPLSPNHTSLFPSCVQHHRHHHL